MKPNHAKKNGKIIALTRSGYEAHTSPYIQHHKFSEWVSEREKIFDTILKEGERLVGEWLIQSHGIRYKINSEPIVFFDWFTSDNNRKLFGELHNLTLKYSIPLVRILHVGDSIKTDELIKILNHRDAFISSIEKPEGMVYRVERKGKVDFLAKWVRQDFEPGKYCIGVEESKLIWNV